MEMNWLCLHPHKPSIYISICFTFMYLSYLLLRLLFLSGIQINEAEVY